MVEPTGLLGEGNGKGDACLKWQKRPAHGRVVEGGCK